MEKDFDEWNHLKKETDALVPKNKIREGEIRWCRMGINIGNEVLGKGNGFKRPVLILKKYSGDVFLGLPITSKIKNDNWYYHVSCDGSLKSIILNQSRVLDRRRLEEKLVELSKTELDLIKRIYCDLILSKS